MTNEQLQHVCDVLMRGGIGVMPTDTIFGLVARAQDRDAVERTYALKKRQNENPFLIVISEIAQIGLFGITLSAAQEDIVKKLWSSDNDVRRTVLRASGYTGEEYLRPISVIIPCDRDDFFYVHRGHCSIGFRLIDRNDDNVHARDLAMVIDHVGPLVATSANISGSPFATSIDEARAYFGEHCDFYVSQQRELHTQPSIVLSLRGDVCELVRS